MVIEGIASIASIACLLGLLDKQEVGHFRYGHATKLLRTLKFLGRAKRKDYCYPANIDVVQYWNL